MEIKYDIPTYPELGKIHKGDYYEEIPYQEYINTSQEIPTGNDVFDIRAFGAVAEEGVLNTEAFKKATEACRKQGGGTILVTGGTYRTGTVWIPSNTTLFITPDATIEASRNAELLIDPALAENGKYGEESTEGALIRAKGEKNIKITGGGKISGSGEWYVYEPRELPSLEPFPITRIPRRDQADKINAIPDTIRYYYRQRIRYAEDKYGEGLPVLKRPSYMVWIEHSKNVVIDNIILHDAMTWTLNVDCCNQVEIRNMIIDDNRHVANTDGIDITGSSNVTIEHCFISCADDGICLKNPKHTNRSMENIYVNDCIVISVMNAFKIGTGTRHDISNVLVENCLFTMPDIHPGSVSGISIESCDGTKLNNVIVRNIEMENVGCPLYILLNMRNQAKLPYTEEVKNSPYWGGEIQNIVIENIKAKDVEVPSILTGFLSETKKGKVVRKALKNIRISDFTVVYRDNKEILEIPEQVPEFLYDYPECNAHGDVPACGIWARRVDGLSLNNITIVPRKENTRKDIVGEDVTFLEK